MARAEGWNVVMLDYGLDLSTPYGEFGATMLMAAAQLERDLASLWLRCLPAMISSLLQASELARQLGDLGGRVFDGLHGALVHDLDGRDVRGDLPVALSQLSQRASRVVGRDRAARDLRAKSSGFGDHVAESLFDVTGRAAAR